VFWLDWRLILKLEKPLQFRKLTIEEVPDPISKCVEPEVRDAKDVPRNSEDMAGQDPQLHAQSRLDGRKVGGRGHLGHQGLKPVIYDSTIGITFLRSA